MTSYNKYKQSGVKITSVSHCTKINMISVTTPDGFPCGIPIGWCLNEELGQYARNVNYGELEYIGLRIYNEKYGECWGHALKQHLTKIFE